MFILIALSMAFAILFGITIHIEPGFFGLDIPEALPIQELCAKGNSTALRILSGAMTLVSIQMLLGLPGAMLIAFLAALIASSHFGAWLGYKLHPLVEEYLGRNYKPFQR